MKTFNTLMCICLVALLRLTPETSATDLKEGFYQESCPSAEWIVRNAVTKAVKKNPGMGAGLIRLHFHDCFVRGCDASLLIKSTPGSPAERDNPANGPSLRGFEVIDKAKAELEVECPGIVSCSDVLAFAARDSSYRLGGIFYDVVAGRRDGTVSLSSEVGGNLPPPVQDVEQLLTFFTKKGLSLQQMVALSGAHSIGIAECSTFTNRLYAFNSTLAQDPSLDPNFAAFLKNKCPNLATNGTVNFDITTPERLDTQYYGNLKRNMGLLASDQILESNPLTKKIVKKYRDHPDVWATDFAAAMLQMGSIEILTGTLGEIRKHCGVVNN